MDGCHHIIMRKCETTTEKADSSRHSFVLVGAHFAIIIGYFSDCSYLQGCFGVICAAMNGNELASKRSKSIGII